MSETDATLPAEAVSSPKPAEETPEVAAETQPAQATAAEESAEVAEQTTQLADAETETAEETAAPAKEEAKPVEETAAPIKQEAEPAEETAAPTKEEAKSAEMTTAAKDQDTEMLKTTAKLDRDNYRNNRKFDPSVRDVTDDPVAIRKQVEFYFGDWNFPQDKFMWETCEGTANKPMDISKIHSFKRMRTFQPYSAVVAALRESKFLDVEGEEGKETVKRKVPYKPLAEARSKVEAATVYVKGFGDENPDTQFDLESFFAQFGEIKGLKLRRTNEGLFKGSVFVTFPDEEAAKKFIAMDPAPTYKGHELKIMSKRDYCDEKSDLIRQGKLEPNSTTQKKFYEGRDPNKKNFRGKDQRSDSDDWKKRREQDQKNGFQDRRGGGRGRGGRGRGRGGGRGGRDGGGRDRDHNRQDNNRQDSNDARRENSNDARPPHIQSTAGEASDTSAAANGKRGRDGDETAEGAPAAKKVDTKQSAAAEAT
ncbi:hypothetical protein HIM_02712 [Hirsutella minnesotensis 3608]|nr:hypothetical protein HIM_02712 [Hirsutella minnesotensis 3608]